MCNHMRLTGSLKNLIKDKYIYKLGSILDNSACICFNGKCPVL